MFWVSLWVISSSQCKAELLKYSRKPAALLLRNELEMRAVQCLLCHWCVYELTIGCVVATVVLMVIGVIPASVVFSTNK